MLFFTTIDTVTNFQISLYVKYKIKICLETKARKILNLRDILKSELTR